jgi:HD-GYP domain-containing protein (c-di-GMP phosphodiesterase class II)
MNTPSSPSDNRIERQKSQNFELNRDAIKILNLLYSINKTLKIYDINNVLAVDLIKSLHQVIQDVILKYNEASILLHQNSLFLNRVKIKFGYSSCRVYNFIEREFHSHDISQLNFFPGISEEQLIKFLTLFKRKEEKVTNSFNNFKDVLKSSGLDTVTIERYVHTERKKEGENEKKQAARAYFWGIIHLKEIFQKYKSKKNIPILTTKRLIQTLFMRLSDNESFLYGMTTIKNFDGYTLNHSVNVCILSLAMGKRLGLDKSELIDLGISAFFHDIGKLDVPKDVLDKPGKLDHDERQVIEKHSHYGAETLVRLRYSNYIPISAISVAMEHHSGEGDRAYPRYTKKKNIGLYSKIVKIIDVFDAITTKRPYRKKVFTRVEALNFMAEKLTGEFDPVLLKVFIRMIGECPVGTLVLLDTGEAGIVNNINPSPAFQFRPLIKLITDKTGNRIDGDIVDLSGIEPGTDNFMRSIVKILDPSDYDIRISDYFVAQTL